MVEQRQVDWLGVLVAVLLIVVGIGILAYAVMVFNAFFTTNLGGYGFYFFVSSVSIGGLVAIGFGVKCAVASITGE